jgi:hypothetical protein
MTASIPAAFIRFAIAILIACILIILSSRCLMAGDPAADKAMLDQRKQAHWAWKSVRKQQPPAVRQAEWVADPIDAFILARLEEKALQPAPQADRRTWLRRVTFDLIGLPPTPEEIDAFLKDDSKDANAGVVDRLLKSPHFGERWGRHWLDLVRYAESRGHEFDPIIPNAFQYRDYVIRAINADVPYDQFVTEHLAGDLLPHPRKHPEKGFNESILGTGFWFLGEEVHSPVDIRQDQADRFDNRIDVMSKTFLGLTVACARCHEHKFDAITQRDYYSLLGFLSSSSYRLARFESLDQDRAVAIELGQLRERQRQELGKALARAARPAFEHLPDYLLAGREAMLVAQAGTTPQQANVSELGDPYRQRIAEIATAHKLEPALLTEWVGVLLKAMRDPNEPFHTIARVAADPDAADAKRWGELLRPTIEQARKENAAAREALKDTRLIVDYAHCEPADWLQDDAAYGTGPAHIGDVRLSGDVSHPTIRFVDRAAASYDRRFDVLKLAPGCQTDPGALGKIALRSGRTLSTPSFRIREGKLHYLVRGAGAAYAAVGAHVEIDGPLHGQLVMSFPNGDSFRWYTQDLTRYVGLDAHIEFTAAAGSDFAVAMVVEGRQVPPAPTNPNVLRSLLLSDDASSLTTLTAAHGRLFADLLRRLSADSIASAEQPSSLASLANWLLQHPQLLDGQSRKVTEIASALLDEESKIAARIKPESQLAPAMQDGSALDEHLFIRGVPAAEDELTPRRFLEALAGPRPLATAHGSGRLELARQITDPEVNPFIARVMVNRVWQHLFGRGIVASVDNFGVMGEAPTHPELLDFLADRFVKDGWSTKKLIRELVLSSAYRMSTQPTAEAEGIDPTNQLLHRMRLRRLEGEAIRDSMLQISGRLDRAMYGPSVPIYLTPFLDGRGRPGSGPLDGDGRRSIYLAVKRNFLSPMLLAFDTPSPFSTVGRRTVSNVPAQGLILLNDPFVHQQAEAWAKRTLTSDETPQQRIKYMYLSAFGRLPSEIELKACSAFLERQAELQKLAPSDLKVWTDLAHTLFNVKEFIFVN